MQTNYPKRCSIINRYSSKYRVRVFLTIFIGAILSRGVLDRHYTYWEGKSKKKKRMLIVIPILLPHRFHKVFSLRKKFLISVSSQRKLCGNIEFLILEVTIKKKQIRLKFKGLDRFLQNLVSKITQY